MFFMKDGIFFSFTIFTKSLRTAEVLSPKIIEGKHFSCFELGKMNKKTSLKSNFKALLGEFTVLGRWFMFLSSVLRNIKNDKNFQ